MSAIAPRPQTPTRPGEVVCEPAFADWRALCDANRAAASEWEFTIAGMSAQSLRQLARAEAGTLSGDFSARLGVEVRASGSPDQLMIATGHQPVLYHPGVWIKDFLLERFALANGATAVDVVVDTDAFDEVSIDVPCKKPAVRRCHHTLMAAKPDQYYAASSTPSESEVHAFLNDVEESISTLDSSTLQSNWAQFATHLATVVHDASNLAELITMARRRHEAQISHGYRELPLTALVDGLAFAVFVADLAGNAQRFAQAYNGELSAYRTATGTRSVAQPVPDLRIAEGIELPLWALQGGRRHPVFVQRRQDSIRLGDGNLIFAECSSDPQSLIECITQGEVSYAPKALALTLFMRMFCCDLFIHGTGGGRYDRVTDGVIRRFYGVDPPGFAVASATLELPLASSTISHADVSAAREQLNRMAHHPDEVLAEMGESNGRIPEGADALLVEKKQLIAQIAEPGANRKALGIRIREVNGEMAAMLSSLREDLVRRLADAESDLAVQDILTDREYAFCFWSAAQLRDMAGRVP